MADYYNYYVTQAQSNSHQYDDHLLAARMRERERERILEKRKNSLLYQTNYDDNGNFRPNRFSSTVNNKPIVSTMSRNSNRRNSNRRNSSKKSKGGRKTKSGRKTKKNGW
jgi:hypothetical protein